MNFRTQAKQKTLGPCQQPLTCIAPYKRLRLTATIGGRQSSLSCPPTFDDPVLVLTEIRSV